MMNYLKYGLCISTLLIISTKYSISQVQTKYLIDFSESGESMFFNLIDTNYIEIIMSPQAENQTCQFLISKGAKNQSVNFVLKGYGTDYEPEFSYDQTIWEFPSEEWKDQAGNLCFCLNFEKDSAFVSLKKRKDLKFSGGSVSAVTYYNYQRYLSYLISIHDSPRLNQKVIGKSVEGRDINLITITNFDVPDSSKKCVWIVFRQHCDEDEVSYILEGMVNYLLSDELNSEAKDILNRTVYHIIPIVNVDGTYHQLARVNRNGVDLNRCWSNSSDYSKEEPEISAVHNAIDNLLLIRNVDLVLDMHGWGNTPYDGGYRSTAIMTSESYVQEQKTFLHHLTDNDIWQNFEHWTYSAGNPGMLRLEIYKQHGLNILTSESTAFKRFDGTPVTIENYQKQGIAFCKAIDEYLFHINFTDSLGEMVQSYFPDEKIFLELNDLDEKYTGKKEVTISSSSGDKEKIILQEVPKLWGTFRTSNGIQIYQEDVTLYDGIFQGVEGDTLLVTYQDNDFKGDSCWNLALVSDLLSANESIQYSKSKLEQNFPNPFDVSTTITYTTQSEGLVSVEVFNMSGQKIKTLVNEKQSANTYQIIWNGKNDLGKAVQNGSYLYIFKDGNNIVKAGKMLLNR